jgi:hypothetical protein
MEGVLKSVEKAKFDTIPESQNVDGKINPGTATCCSLPKFRVKGDCTSVNEISEKTGCLSVKIPILNSRIGYSCELSIICFFERNKKIHF